VGESGVVRNTGKLVAISALVALVALFTTACGGTSRATTSATARSAPVPPSRPRTSGPVAPPPLPARNSTGVVVTPDDVLLFGGASSDARGHTQWFADGARFDRHTGSWSTTARPPFDGALIKVAAVATRAGDVVVVGVECLDEPTGPIDEPECGDARYRAARYRPANNAWERLPAPRQGPVRADDEAPAAYGMTDAGAVFGLAVEHGLVLVYDGARNTWSEVPKVAGIVEPYCAMDEAFVAVGGREVASQVDPDGEVSDADFNSHVFRAGAWSNVESHPRELDDQITSSVVCGRNAVVYLPWRTGPVAGPTWWFDAATAAWSPAPPLEVPVGRLVSVSRLDDGTRLVAFADADTMRVFVDAPGSSTWQPTTYPRAADHALLVDGGQALLFPPNPARDGFVIAAAPAGAAG
jgi:hypothetical protein